MKEHKTTVFLGCLPIGVEDDNLEDLIEKQWKIAKLNEAIIQEGEQINEWHPYSERDPQGHRRTGFIHLTDGRRIELGHRADLTLYPRFKGADSYKGITPAFRHDNQLPERASEGWQESNRSKPVVSPKRTLSADSPMLKTQVIAITKLIARLEEVRPELIDQSVIDSYADRAGLSNPNMLSEVEAGQLISYLNTELSR